MALDVLNLCLWFRVYYPPKIYELHGTVRDRLCGLVVRVLGYRSGGPGSIPGTTRFFGKVVGLERGPLSLVSTTEEVLDRKVAAPVSIRKSWQSLRRQAAVARSAYFARGLIPWSIGVYFPSAIAIPR
jgi:hypothetical protein